MSFIADPTHMSGAPVYAPDVPILVAGSLASSGTAAYGTGDQIGALWNGTPSGEGAGNTLGTGGGSSGPLGAMLGMLSQLLAQLGSYLQSALGNSSGNAAGFGGAYGNGNAAGATQYANDLTLSSTGDPHLAETGTITSGGTATTVNAHFNSMSAHADLVSTSDVRGGYQVSTTPTTPDANGITYNASATVTTAGGSDSVTMTGGGNVSVTKDGRALALAPGQTIALRAGESVVRNSDGSVTVSASNPGGGTISTTLRSDGPGVDVTTTAQGLRVGGDIVAGSATSGAPPDVPRVRYASGGGLPAWADDALTV